MTARPDAYARGRIESDLATSLVVEAAAGTGKTTALVRRIVAVLASGATTVERIVAVTFTEKAAGEMKLRLRAELDGTVRGATGPARAALADALARLEEARVDTIHGLCADILRERPAAAGVDPNYRLLEESAARRIHAEAFDGWLSAALPDAPEGLRRSLRRVPWSGETPAGRLRSAAWELVEWPDYPAPWTRSSWPRRERLDACVAALLHVADLRATGAKGDPFVKDTEPLGRFAEDLRRLESVGPRDHDWVEARLADLDRARKPPREGRGRTFGTGVARADVLAAHRAFRETLRALVSDLDADLAASLHGDLRKVLARFDELKARAGALTFVDLLLLTRKLLRERDDVRAELAQRFTHVFVDEFQDTDPLQAEIVLLLAAAAPASGDGRRAAPAPGKLFLVGDPKQSIYRFRRADVGIYQQVRAELVSSRVGPPSADFLRLATSFRAVPSLQRALNAAFQEEMREDEASHQAAYVDLSPDREDLAGQPHLVALPVPRPMGTKGKPTKTAIEASLPDAVGAFLSWLFSESGWTVTVRGEPGRVPVAPRHVCILFRRFESFDGDVTQGYVEALDAREIPHMLVGGRSFHAREEVDTLRATLQAVEWPDDELSVFAALKGSLFAIPDDVLLEFRAGPRSLHPFRPADGPVPEHLVPVTEALAVLAELHRERNGRSVADTLARLLAATRAWAGFALRPNGDRVVSNVMHLWQLARLHDAEGGLSFRGFVEKLARGAEEGEVPEAPLLEEDSDGVRLMTVHRAKGLEFPVVVLADLTAKLHAARARRHLDAERGLCAMAIGGWSPRELREHEAEELAREEAEGVRVAYVAATRARDLLVVPAVGTGPWRDTWMPGAPRPWLDPLSRAIYPPPDAWALASPAPGCPTFGRRSLVELPDDTPAGPCVAPGLHRRDGFDVVWWDPGVLALRAEPTFGLRQDELLREREGEDGPSPEAAAHARWAAARGAARRDGAVPSCLVHVATDPVAPAPEPLPDVMVIVMPRDAARPSGRRFGTLVHATLATVPLDAAPDAVAAVARLEGRLLGASAVEVAAAAAAVSAALTHAVLRAARSAELVRREVPVTLHAEDAVVEGVVDLAFRKGGRYTVVDFKTDASMTESLDAYRRQVGLYAAAIERATGCPAQAILLRV